MITRSSFKFTGDDVAIDYEEEDGLDWLQLSEEQQQERIHSVTTIEIDRDLQGFTACCVVAAEVGESYCKFRR